MKTFLIMTIILNSIIRLTNGTYDCDKLNSSMIKIDIIFTEGDTKVNEVDSFIAHKTLISLQINNFNSFSEINIDCSIFFNIDIIEITPKQKIILDSSFNINGLHLYQTEFVIYFFSNLKGINVDLNLFKNTFNSSRILLDVILSYSSFDFYLPNAKLLDNEADCNSYRLQEPNFFTNLNSLQLKPVIYSTKVCPMLFMSSKINYLYLNSISNSYMNKNRLYFMPINDTNSKILKLVIDALELDLHYENLNRDILNENLFKDIKRLTISFSNLYGLEADLFKNFFYLKLLEWSTSNIRNFFYTTQNKWINSIKDLNKKTGFDMGKFIKIVFSEDTTEFNFYETYVYPEEDFCLFVEFQHKSLLYTIVDPGHKINCSCTVVWILKYTEKYFDVNLTHIYYPYRNYFAEYAITIPLRYCLFEPNYNDLLKQCDFETKQKRCNQSEFTKMNQNESFLAFNSNYDLINFLQFIQYILIVYLNQIFAFIGILTNILVVVVVANIKNLKKGKPKEANNEKDNMFKYILVHSVFNVIYCLILSFKSINLCLSFTSTFFCSSITTELSAQSFKIIFIEYFGNIAKTCCNVSYTAISISRIFLTGSKKNKGCLSKFNNLNIKIYLIVMVVLSSLLSIFKFFQYTLNRLSFSDTDSFPMTNNNNSNCNNYIYDFMKCKFWEVWRIVNNFLNDIFFFVITIVFDIAVLKNIASMISSKKTMVENFKEAEEEKKRKRILKMIIINGIIFTLSHLPEFLISILLLVFQNKLDFCTNFECSILNDFGQFFIYFSIMSQLSINNNFNSLFKESFDNIILRLKKNCISKRET